MNRRSYGVSAILLVLSLMLSACEQSTPPEQNKNDLSKRADSSSPDSKLTTNDQNSVNAEAIETLKNNSVADTEPVVQQSARLDSAATTKNGAELKAALVEDMGFSTETATELDEVATAAPYCLGEEIDPNHVTAAEACDRIANRLASVSNKRCNAARLRPSSCSSVNGFPIFISEFPPLANRQPQGRILVIGGIHGDELTSVSIVFKWIAKLNKFHSGLFHWHVVPMMNPDGVLQRGAQRTNKNGVDLNRNLPSDDWQENALLYWRDKQGENPRRYPGEEPASEPETQWLIDEINDFKPDAIISVHAPYGVVDFDALLLNTAPKSLGKLHLNLLGTYPGSLGNYAGINRNIPVITLELPHAWVMPSEQETTKIWEDIVSWLRENVNTEIAGSE